MSVCTDEFSAKVTTGQRWKGKLGSSNSVVRGAKYSSARTNAVQDWRQVYIISEKDRFPHAARVKKPLIENCERLREKANSCLVH